MPPSDIISRDPCDGSELFRAPALDPAAAPALVSAARRGFAQWAATAPSARLAVARTFAERVRGDKTRLAELIARETGKPAWEALGEVESVAGKIEASATAREARAGERRLGPGQSVSHRPLGVMAVIGPFNFPAHLPNGHITPALLAGNAVIFKPSEKTPATGARLAALWREAGLPEGVLQVAQGGPDVGAALVASPGVDGVLFTGSAGAGLAIHRALAGRPDVLLALELGGNNPLVIWEAGDIEGAAHIAAQSAYVTAGQRCACARRLIVADDRAGEAALEALVEVAARLRVGRPFDDPAPFLGPVIDIEAAERALDAQAALIRLGARPIAPMRPGAGGLPFLTPGVLDVTGIDAPDAEVFAPLLQVTRAPTFDAALARANATRFGLSAGLVSARADLFERFRAEVRAGVVNWNRPTTGASALAPFGGVGLSGNHRPSAAYAADACAFPVATTAAAEADFRIGEGMAGRAQPA